MIGLHSIDNMAEAFMNAFWTPDSQALAPYLAAWQQAHKGLQIIAGSLQPGMTEQDCELLIRDWLRAHQLFDPARPPKVRFTAQPTRRRFGLNRPGKRRYRIGMGYILRCDAVQNGYAAKACLSGPDAVPLAALHRRLRDYRDQLPQALARGETPQQLADRFPGLRQHYRLAPLTGTLPEGNRIGEGPLIPGLWQWQLTLSDGTHSAGSSEFLLMDDQGPRWLTDTPAHLLDTNNNGNNHKQEEAA
ncbi:hypothetical protein [Alcanivorax sp.]|uniref:hypothetical protein n=1 Tax=Alcanivorax sp. TaxID=1872427 RepID=UPI000C444614|nr:hypothetical protein [Alcanivorax sp.]MBQ23724.1 hypothetical protein [Alcanivorax sp.]